MFIQWTGRTRIKIRKQKPEEDAHEWEVVRGRILAALARYPEAERAVIEAFQKEDDECRI